MLKKSEFQSLILAILEEVKLPALNKIATHVKSLDLAFIDGSNII